MTRYWGLLYAGIYWEKLSPEKNGPNPNSERAEETHRARDRNYTSFRAFREATTNSSEKEAATTRMIVYAYLDCFYLIQTTHTFFFVWEKQYILDGSNFNHQIVRAFGYHRNAKNMLPDEAERKFVVVSMPV